MQTIRIIVAATTFLFSAARVAAAGDEIVFPRHPNVVDVSRPLYNAKGDGVTDNTVPGLYSYGTLCVLDAKLTGRGDATEKPAIINFNGGRILLRNISTSGYEARDRTSPSIVRIPQPVHFPLRQPRCDYR